MKILVTGAAGFIGSVLLRRLLGEGLSIRAASRQPHTDPAGTVEWCRVAQVDSVAAWREAVADCDVVIHLAALAHQTGSAGRGRWSEFERVNVEGTRSLARVSREAGVRRLLFVSSVAAVCTRSATPVDDSTPSSPDDDYGRSKLQAELALRSELQGAALEWCILRPPLVYGAGNPGNMERLLKLMDSGLPLPFASIRNRRSFLYVDNLADALLCVLRTARLVPDTFMVSDGSDFSTPALVAALAGAGGARARLVPMPVAALKLMGRAGDLAASIVGRNVGFDSYSVGRLTGSLTVDSSRFRQIFSWRPPVPVEEALRRTVASAGPRAGTRG